MSYQTFHHNRNYGCRITELTLEGHRCVALENEELRVTIIADKGTDIYEFLYKPRDVDFMWRTWAGLRERSHFEPSSPRAAGAHLDYYEGGWQELFPNCGNISLHQGAEVGQHGEVLLLPWATYRTPPWNHGEVVLDPWSRLLTRPVIWNDGTKVGDVELAPDDPIPSRAEPSGGPNRHHDGY